MLSVIPVQDFVYIEEIIEVVETHEATCQCTTTKAKFILTLLKLFQEIRLNFPVRFTNKFIIFTLL